jgi:hypothetical protein
MFELGEHFKKLAGIGKQMGINLKANTESYKKELTTWPSLGELDLSKLPNKPLDKEAGTNLAIDMLQTTPGLSVGAGLAGIIKKSGGSAFDMNANLTQLKMLDYNGNLQKQDIELKRYLDAVSGAEARVEGAKKALKSKDLSESQRKFYEEQVDVYTKALEGNVKRALERDKLITDDPSKFMHNGRNPDGSLIDDGEMPF